MAVSFEDVQREARARKEGRTTRKGPGIEQSLLRGIYKAGSPRYATGTELQEKLGFDRPEWGTPLDEEAERKRLNEAVLKEEPWRGIPEPTTGPERIAQGVGESLPTIAVLAPFAPLLAPGAPLAAAASELGLGTLGVTAAESVKEAGGGPISQFGAEVIAASAAPLARPVRAARNVGKNSVLRNLDPAARPMAEAVAAKHGVPVETVMRGASELKRKFARGVDDPDKYIERATEKLGQDHELFDTTPSLAQSTSEFGGQNVASMELNLAKRDQDYASDALGRRLDVLEEVEGNYASIRPDGTYGAAQEGYEATRIARVAEEADAWRRVPEESVVSTAPLQEAVKELRAGTRASQQYLPNEIRIIDELGDSTTLAEIQDLRRELLETARDARAPMASSGDRRRGQKTVSLLKAIDEVLEDLPQEGSDLYQAARDMTRRNRELFDPRSKAVKAFDFSDSSRAVGSIRNAKDPANEARRALEMMGGDEQAIDGLRSAFFEDVFGEAIGDKPIKYMRNRVKTRRGMYQEIFGEEGLKFIDAVIEKQGVAAAGKVGTSAQAASTGTGQAFIGQLLSYASDANNVAWSASKRLMSVLGDKALSREEVVTLLRMATQDTRLAKDLLEIPVPRAEPAWRVSMMLAIERARQQTTYAAARNTRNISDNEGDRR